MAGLSRGLCSLADAEAGEEPVEHMLHIDPAGDFPNRPGGEAHFLGRELKGSVGLQHLSRPQHAGMSPLQGVPVALPGHDGVAPSKGGFRLRLSAGPERRTGPCAGMRTRPGSLP